MHQVTGNLAWVLGRQEAEGQIVDGGVCLMLEV